MVSKEMSNWTKTIVVKYGQRRADQKEVWNTEKYPDVFYVVFYDGLDIGDKRQEEGKRTKRCLAITRNYDTTGIALCGMLIHVWD